MNIRNEVLRTDQVMQALLDQNIKGSVVMVHVLKFKPNAEYADGRETNLTGPKPTESIAARWSSA